MTGGRLGRLVIVFVTCILIAACGSSAPSEYGILGDADAATTETVSGDEALEQHGLHNIDTSSDVAGAGTNVTSGSTADSDTKVREDTDINTEDGDKNTMIKRPVTVAPMTGETLGIKYEILKNYSYHLQSETCGYVIDNFNNPGGPFYLIITSGMKPTGGYSIMVTDIQAEGDSIVVTVAEQGPAAGATVTTALTYPLCAVMFNIWPDNVIVKDISGNVFNYIDNTI